jgi:metallo-beta-lactamase class B
VTLSRICRYCLCWAVLLTTVALGQSTTTCSSCAEWNRPQTSFQIFGNTYYVGTRGLSSILITSDAGSVLIDGDLPESAGQIAANIRSLGFRIEDVKIIVNSHVHFDHAGGIRELQRLSGARVYASPWSAEVMRTGAVAHDDPQYSVISPISPVKNVTALHDGETLKLGRISLTAHLTPGHTPGGTSWTWQSCEADICYEMVYADSLTPVSAPGFHFTEHAQLVHGFEKSFAFLETTPCDILITPHPEASELWDRIEGHRRGIKPDPLVDQGACRRLAQKAQDRLAVREHEEAAKLK